MFPQLIDGKVMVPIRVEGPDGLIGDAWREVTPDQPEYTELYKWLTCDKPVTV